MAYQPFFELKNKKLSYDQQILQILTEVGERGISVPFSCCFNFVRNMKK